MIDPSVTLAGVRFNGPAFTASGCAAAGKELRDYFDLTEIGGVVTKSIMLRPRSGRPTPRMVETPSGMLNSIGLQGPGVETFLANDLAWLRENGVTAVVSIAGETVDEFGQLARILRNEPGIAALEVNISCPNVESRGQVFACDVMSASGVIHQVRRNTNSSVPIFAKLSPDVTSIAEIAVARHNAGADGLAVMNTTLGMAIDTETLRPILGGVTGGLSGPAIRPLALRCVWQVHQALPDAPILGMGGIANGADALQFIAAGASAVEVGTMTFNDPSAPARVQRELLALLDQRGFGSVAQADRNADRGGQRGPRCSRRPLITMRRRHDRPHRTGPGCPGPGDGLYLGQRRGRGLQPREGRTADLPARRCSRGRRDPGGRPALRVVPGSEAPRHP